MGEGRTEVCGYICWLAQKFRSCGVLTDWWLWCGINAATAEMTVVAAVFVFSCFVSPTAVAVTAVITAVGSFHYHY